MLLVLGAITILDKSHIINLVFHISNLLLCVVDLRQSFPVHEDGKQVLATCLEHVLESVSDDGLFVLVSPLPLFPELKRPANPLEVGSREGI